jgi:hypothetical protein
MGIPVYAYEFTDQNAPYYYPPMPGFTPLAAHTIDIQFLFPLSGEPSVVTSRLWCVRHNAGDAAPGARFRSLTIKIISREESVDRFRRPMRPLFR